MKMEAVTILIDQFDQLMIVLKLIFDELQEVEYIGKGRRLRVRDTTHTNHWNVLYSAFDTNIM